LIVDVKDKINKKKKKEKDAVLCDIWMKLGNRTNLYPLMRLLLPQLDTERPTYGLRESTIGDMYVKAMGIAKTSEAAQRLKNYKNPRSAGAKAEAAAGDFTTILYDVLRNRAGVREGAGMTRASPND
jgi:DNA ligase-4